MMAATTFWLVARRGGRLCRGMGRALFAALLTALALAHAAPPPARLPCHRLCRNRSSRLRHR